MSNPTVVAETHRIGDAGVQKVKGHFTDINWGALENNTHDHGIDLMVFVRDAKGEEIGHTSVQVKTGASYFSEPVKGSSGEVLGWTYRGTPRHLEYWLNQPTPHFLVLHDLAESTSFWEVIVPQTVEKTKKGWKVFVPRANTVSVAGLSSLLRAWASTSAQIVGEGEAWYSSDSKASFEVRRRLALMAPRSIAPHQNRGSEDTLDQPAALALVMLGRVGQIARLSERSPSVPSLPEAENHPSWDWRFVGALAKWIETGEIDLLIACCSVRLLSKRSAAIAVTSAALLDIGSLRSAMDLLGPILKSPRLSPLDRAWLLSQRGRLQTELGVHGEAKRDLKEAQSLLETMPGQEARGVLAAVKSNLWRLGGARSGDRLGDLIVHSDNRFMWWRTMGAAFDLADRFDELFDNRVERFTNRVMSTRGSHNGQSPAWLNATVLSDHSNAVAWQVNSVKASVASGPIDSDEAKSSLLRLHRSGAATALGALAYHLWSVGPTSALSDVVQSVCDEPLTKTTLLSTLELLRVAPDLAGRRAAAAARLSVNGLIRSDSAISDLIDHGTSGWYEFGKTAVAILPWVGLNFHRTVAGWMVETLEADSRGPLETQMVARFAYRIRWTDLPKSVQVRIALAAEQAVPEDIVLAEALVGRLSSDLPEVASVRSALLKRAREGDFDALVGRIELESGRLPDLPEEILADALSTQTERIVAEARLGRHSFPKYRLGMLQSWYSLSHGPRASWGKVFSLLEESAVAAEHKIDVCKYLADHIDDMTDDFKDELAEVLAITVSGESLWTGESVEAYALKLQHRIGSISPDEVIGRIAEWACSTRPQDRKAAAMLSAEDLGWGAGEASAWLMGLITDPLASVSLRAVESMGFLLPKVGSPVLSLLDRMVASDEFGIGRSLALLQGLKDSHPSNTVSDWSGLSWLERHPSRAVRRKAASVRSG